MATSEVSICNLALQKLGTRRIVSLSEDSVEAREVAACYEQQRDNELRKYLWKFAKKRVVLGASAVIPAFTYALAFPLPADCLRVIKPVRVGLDWSIEQHDGALALLTNDGDSIEFRYIARVTDPTLFDPSFIEMLACKIAWHTCEKITQSNTKKQALNQEYLDAKAEARRTNAFELAPQEEPEDTWLTARQGGSRNWLRFGDD